jgi:hypothetical protein
VVRGVARGRQDVDRSVAKVENRLAAWPLRDPEVRRDLRGADGGNRAQRQVRELAVARPVVAAPFATRSIACAGGIIPFSSRATTWIS